MLAEPEDWLIKFPADTSRLADAQYPILLLAHGAGAPMDSDWMQQITALLVASNIVVIRFEFPYMRQRRLTGKRLLPDKQPQLLERWRQVIQQLREKVGDRPIWIGGKSLGGRMATLIADEQRPAGVVCLGYPFHPPGKPQQLRTGHLKSMQTPCLIIQGSRDGLGNRQEVSSYELSTAIELVWLTDGDHDLKPRKRSGFTLEQHLQSAVMRVEQFMQAG